MEKKYILALDQGTTSSKAIIFNKNAQIIDSESVEFRQIYPKPSWVEHSPEEIYDSIIKAINIVIKRKNIKYEEIDSIAITNQRETTILWDKTTGKPVANAIVWQCRRTAERCNEIKTTSYIDTIFDKTGLVVDPYFSATKIEYLLNNTPGLKEKAKNGKIAFGTVDSFLVYHLTGKKRHITDYSNASRTMLFNIHSLKWDDDLLDFFGIPKEILPEVISNSQIEIYADPSLFGGQKIPISGIVGDQQGALFGQCCFNDGDIKNTYGTGCFLLMNTGKIPKKSKNRLLTTIGWNIDGKTIYALEGAVFIAGAVIQWLRDGLQIINSSEETEKIAMNSKNDSLMFVPTFSGLGTPYWDPDVKGGIFGITRDTTRQDIIKAALEGIAFQAKDLLEAMKDDFGNKIGMFKVDGGASKNKFLMQFQADLIQENISMVKLAETTALGAAFLAGLATKFFPDLKYIENITKETIDYSPKMSKEVAEKLYRRWKIAVEAIRSFKEF
ncbi:MAG: glycerol kinase [Spirochaetes bacterium GWC1_27_15]|nr:MAG: glycerol kinase [Spirochaetes bacterium GWC1_27_15]